MFDGEQTNKKDSNPVIKVWDALMHSETFSTQAAH